MGESESKMNSPGGKKVECKGGKGVFGGIIVWVSERGKTAIGPTSENTREGAVMGQMCRKKTEAEREIGTAFWLTRKKPNMGERGNEKMGVPEKGGFWDCQGKKVKQNETLLNKEIHREKKLRKSWHRGQNLWSKKQKFHCKEAKKGWQTRTGNSAKAENGLCTIKRGVGTLAGGGRKKLSQKKKTKTPTREGKESREKKNNVLSGNTGKAPYVPMTVSPRTWHSGKKERIGKTVFPTKNLGKLVVSPALRKKKRLKK